LNHFTGSTSSFAINSHTLVEEIKNLKVGEEDVIGSFDVASLLTTTPVKKHYREQGNY
jgi:hypothetical protein